MTVLAVVAGDEPFARPRLVDPRPSRSGVSPVIGVVVMVVVVLPAAVVGTMALGFDDPLVELGAL